MSIIIILVLPGTSPAEQSNFFKDKSLNEILPLFQANIFYSGCVIVEVRDYRHCPAGGTYESNYVLLRPTYQVLEVSYKLTDLTPSNIPS